MNAVTYRIAKTMDGSNVWLAPDDPVPCTLSHVRPAPPDIADLAARIEAAEQTGRVAFALGKQMLRLLDAQP